MVEMMEGEPKKEVVTGEFLHVDGGPSAGHRSEARPSLEVVARIRRMT